jgi:hypothetical protein
MKAAESAASARRAHAWCRVWLGIWFVFLGAFFVVGGYGLTAISSRVRVPAQGPDSSTNCVFQAALGVTDAARKVELCVKDVPPQEPIAIVFWDATHTQLATLQLGTLLWPHPVPQVECQTGEPLDPARLTGSPRPYAVFLVGVPIAPGTPGIHSLGPLLHYRILRPSSRP